MTILAVIVVLIVLVALFTLHLIHTHAQDDEKLKFYKDKRTKASLLSRTDDKIVFSFDVPYRNTGTHEAIFLEAFVRVYLPDEQYNGALVRGRVNHPAAPRTDDYFEARLVPGGEEGHLTVTLEVTPRNGSADATAALLGLPDFEVALYVERRGRMALFHNKENILLPREELQALVD